MASPPPTPRVVAEWTVLGDEYAIDSKGTVAKMHGQFGSAVDDPAGLGPKLARLILDVEATIADLECARNPAFVDIADIAATNLRAALDAAMGKEGDGG